MCMTLFAYVYLLCEIFAIIIAHVEYLNFVETLKEIIRKVDYLKSKFEMKDHGK